MYRSTDRGLSANLAHRASLSLSKSIHRQMPESKTSANERYIVITGTPNYQIVEWREIADS